MGILELHLHEPAFNFAPSVGGDTGGRSRLPGTTGDDQESDESGGPGRMAAVLGLAALVGIAVAVRRLRGGRDVERDHPESKRRPTAGT